MVFGLGEAVLQSGSRSRSLCLPTDRLVPTVCQVGEIFFRQLTAVTISGITGIEQPEVNSRYPKTVRARQLVVIMTNEVAPVSGILGLILSHLD